MAMRSITAWESKTTQKPWVCPASSRPGMSGISHSSPLEVLRATESIRTNPSPHWLAQTPRTLLRTTQMGLLREGAGDPHLSLKLQRVLLRKAAMRPLPRVLRGGQTHSFCSLRAWLPGPGLASSPYLALSPRSSYLTPLCFSSLWVKRG